VSDAENRPPWPLGKTNRAKLALKKYRQRWGLYLLEGESTVRDAIMSGSDIHGVLFDPRLQEKSGDNELLQIFKKHNVSVIEVEEAELKAISGLTTPPPVLAIMLEKEPDLPSIPPEPPMILALDRVQDPGNVGTLIRSAAFYGIKEIWLGRGTVERYNPKVLRAAMAAHLQLSVIPNVDLHEAVVQAKNAGCPVYVADMEGGEEVGKIDSNHPPILILGNEPAGVDPELVAAADSRVAILRRGPVDSLNVAMAGTVLMDRLLAKR